MLLLLRMLGWVVCVVYSTIPLFWLMIHPRAHRWRKRAGSPYKVLVPVWIFMWVGVGALTAPWRRVVIYERWWSWRPALYLYLCIFCGVVAAIRRLDAKTILVFTPALANAAVMMVMNVAQDFRYQYPVYAIGLISPALLFCKRASDRPSAAA